MIKMVSPLRTARNLLFRCALRTEDSSSALLLSYWGMKFHGIRESNSSSQDVVEKN